MFALQLQVDRIDKEGMAHPCPVRWIDSFAMRNFTNDAIFDDTLPLSDGLMEVGYRVPLDRLKSSMEDWFRRKNYIGPGEHLRITSASPSPIVQA